MNSFRGGGYRMRELSILIIPKSIITFYLFNTGSRLAVSIGVAVPSNNVQIMIVRLSIQGTIIIVYALDDRRNKLKVKSALMLEPRVS